MSDRTEWYPPNVKPVRVGVYETATTRELKERAEDFWFCNWTGSHFSYCAETPEHAAHSTEESLFNGLVYWRGLTGEAE